jgi:hypothetical protein
MRPHMSKNITNFRLTIAERIAVRGSIDSDAHRGRIT